jgi:hypothetical protein
MDGKHNPLVDEALTSPTLVSRWMESSLVAHNELVDEALRAIDVLPQELHAVYVLQLVPEAPARPGA